jgi:hypothetical protein
LAIVILFTSSEILGILDPPVSEIGTSDFAELGSAEQTVTLCIGQKLNCPIWQTGTSGFFKKNQIFLNSIENLMLAAPNYSPMYFRP